MFLLFTSCKKSIDFKVFRKLVIIFQFNILYLHSIYIAFKNVLLVHVKTQSCNDLH